MVVVSVVNSNTPAAEQIVILSIEAELEKEILSVAGFG